MSELGELLRVSGLTQQALAALMEIPLETLRTWDSGRRPVPTHLMHCAIAVMDDYKRHQWLRLPECAIHGESNLRPRTAVEATCRRSTEDRA
jgi:hypothetical protein